MHQLRDELGCAAQLGERPRQAQRGGQACDSQAGRLRAHDVCHLSVDLSAERLVEGKHVRQHHGERDTVGRSQPGAQPVPDGVAETEAGGGEGEPGQVGRQQHPAAGLEVLPVSDRRRQPFRHRTDDLETEPMGVRVGAPGGERLQGMRERVHTAGGGRPGRQADGQERIQDCGLRHHAVVADIELALRSRVVNDPEAVCLRARPRRGRDRDHRQAREEVVATVVEIVDVDLICSRQRDALGGIQDGAPAEPDHHRLPEPAQGTGASLQRPGVRVGPYGVMKLVLDACAAEHPGHIRDHP